MPIYEYLCDACGERLEVMQKIGERPQKQCPACKQNRLRKLVSASAFRLKGSGWYETDFKKGGKKNISSSGDEASPDKGKDDKGKDDKEKDKKPAKPEEKSEAKESTAESKPAAKEKEKDKTATKSDAGKAKAAKKPAGD